MSMLEYKIVSPEKHLMDVVESIWMLKNNSDEPVDGVVLPDGKFDLFLFKSASEPFQMFYTGIATQPIYKPPYPCSVMFAISFKPLATEYIFKHSFSELVGQQQFLPAGYWGFDETDLDDFEDFARKSFKKINSLFAGEIERRKKYLFELIFSTEGAMSVRQISERVHWNSRQINRYFNQQYGISLKVYCEIIRFHASLKQLGEGDLFPDRSYFDQSHFIRNVKKLTGVSPGILSKNQNDRFVQLSLIKGKYASW